MQVKNQVGKTVAETTLDVNRPVEVLYAAEGTWYTAADNANVRQFEQRYWGAAAVEGTDRHYYDGPNAAGDNSPGIVTNIENDIQADYTTALQRHRKLVIDMVGWSRGCVIVATVANDLNSVTLTPTGFVIGTPATATQHIDVHWVGLFDAVMRMPVNAPHNPWATVFSGNIHSHEHLIHTDNAWDSFWQNYGVPTVTTFNNPITPFDFLPDGRASTHRDVGTNVGALQWMIRRARAAGVPRYCQ